MKNTLRLALVLPALIFAMPSLAQDGPRSPTIAKAPIRYVTLDRMIHAFAERARAERTTHTTVLAQR